MVGSSRRFIHCWLGANRGCALPSFLGQTNRGDTSILNNPAPLNSCNRLNLIDRLSFYLAKGARCIVTALYQMILASNTRAMPNIRLLRKTNIFDYFQDLDIQDRNLLMSDMAGIDRIVVYPGESNTMRSGRVGI